MASGVRQKGLVKLLVGGALAGIVLIVMSRVSQDGIPASVNTLSLIPAAIPGVFALAGLLELVTGMPFTRIGAAWDDLAGWQRGVVGLIVVIAAFAVAIAAMVLFFQP